MIIGTPASARTSRSGQAVELALLVLLAALWGGSYTFIRIGVETIPPIPLIAARTLIAGAILLAILRWRGVSTALAFAIYFRLIRTLGSVGTTSVSYLRVPFGVGIGIVFLGESLSGTAWMGLALVVVGVAAMTLPGETRPARA